MDPTQRIAAAVALLFLLVAGTAPDAAAQSCTLGTAENTLNINNVRAQVFNTGSLFFGGSTTNGDGYYVPKAAQKSPIFASGIWIGGQRDGQLRFAGSRYTNFNFWPGPLVQGTGLPVNPASCSTYDRIYSVSKSDIAAYEGGAAPAADLADWPAQLGAPVVDGDGNPDNYDLAAGDRPEIIGDQGIWWVMNDAGQETHAGSGTGPLGVEVQVLAFAFSRADALGNTTFYKYKVINRGATTITDTYITIFSDPDLGNAGDDFVGYDADLGLGYVYNADDEDEGATGYGVPPAAGYDFFQGPITPAGDTLAASAFSYFINGGPPTSTGDPALAPIMYNFQQGLWGDGTPMRAGGDGYNQPNSFPITKFAFPGDPVTGEAWSEVNNGTATPANAPGDRRLLISTGPFNLEPGVPQDIVFGLVFAQGTSRFNSITALRAADGLAQTAYDINFRLAPPPPPPPLCTEQTSGTGTCAEAIEQNNMLTLVWGYPTTSENYLGNFEVVDELLANQPVNDDTYNFEGFNIYRYPTSSFQTDQRELIATFDKVNGVTTIVDQVFDPELGGVRPTVVARGTDSGIQYSLVVDGLTNFTDYFFGITAYSYNEESTPKVIESSATLITARPSRLTAGVETQSVNGDSLMVTPVTQIGEGTVSAVVVDPTRLTGDTYEIRFINPVDANGNAVTSVRTYNIVNTTTGQTVLDGQAYYTQTGMAYPTGRNIAVVDGFSFSVEAPPPSYALFTVTANAAGPVVPPQPGAAHFNSALFPTPDLNGDGDGDSPTANVQQANSPNRWLFFTGGQYASYDEFISRTTRDGANFEFIGDSDYEMRFTGTSIAAKDGIFGQSGTNPVVPFELWNTGSASPDDPSDDFRMIPIILDEDDDGAYGFVRDPAGGPIVDSPISGGADDPYTDWIYWYTPLDESPGQAGYLAYENGGTVDLNQVNHEVFARTSLVSWNGASRAGNPATALPEQGTIFRIETAKPLAAGSVFSFNTANFRTTEATDASRLAALELIQVVPNPYLGASSYESGNASRVARFTNLPEQAATIRVFTVAGTLVKTLRKDGRSRSLDWDLTTQNNLPVASGMYLIHIDIDGVGERVLKFGVVQRRTEINVF